jgi:hypothetical protein
LLRCRHTPHGWVVAEQPLKKLYNRNKITRPVIRTLDINSGVVQRLRKRGAHLDWHSSLRGWDDSICRLDQCFCSAAQPYPCVELHRPLADSVGSPVGAILPQGSCSCGCGSGSVTAHPSTTVALVDHLRALAPTVNLQAFRCPGGLGFVWIPKMFVRGRIKGLDCRVAATSAYTRCGSRYSCNHI